MAEKLIYSMGEVAEMFDVKPSLLRYWEAQFGALRPKRNKKGNRLYSPADVEALKLIYHLVKERGMTLEGAKKALKQERAEGGVSRDAELMERLQRIRSLLVEVREDLKGNDGEVVAVVTEEFAAESVAASAEEPVAKPRRAKAKPVVKIVEQSGADDVAEGSDAPAAAKPAPVRKSRRKKGDEEHKELFAFYEQSLF